MPKSTGTVPGSISLSREKAKPSAPSPAVDGNEDILMDYMLRGFDDAKKAREAKKPKEPSGR